MHRSPILAALVLLMLALPASAGAGSYWWTGTPTAGSNGFSFSSADAPYWNPWGGHCESRGTTIPAGNPCILAWHVPAGLDAKGGSIRGVLRQANPNFEQRNFVEGNGLVTIQGSATQQSFNRAWPDMGSYLSISLLTPVTATAVAAGSQSFTAQELTVQLADPSTPSLNILGGHAGWHSPSGACVRYGFTDAGSGIQHVRLANADTGVVHDAPSYAGPGIVTGVTQTDRTPCFAAPGTGSFRYRVDAADKSGNAVEQYFTMSFDTTAPTVGAIHVDGEPLEDGAVLLGSVGGYRPALRFDAVDAHAGLASTQLLLDGEVVATGTEYVPTANLARGTHSVEARATDGVGNVTSVRRSFTIVDDVAPILSIGAPDATGDNEPVLDVSAQDDLAGIDPTSWTVRVNGRALVAQSTTHRLQVDVGYLVDGQHVITVSVADAAGNITTHAIDYRADSGDDLPDAPGLTGMYVTSAPAIVEQGSTHHVRAIVVRDGRPVTGHVQLRSGALVIGSAEIQRSGAVDVEAMIDVPGPLVLHGPDGGDFDPVELTYQFVPTPVGDGDDDGDGDDGDGGTGGDGGAGGGGNGAGTTSTTTNNTTNNVTTHRTDGTPDSAGANPPSGGYPRNVVYYVGSVPFWNGIPLAESGARLDQAAPRWRLTLRRERPGTVRRLRRIALRLWTNEMTVLTLTPRGGTRRTTVNPRRTWRTVHVLVGARTPLGRTLARTRPGRMVTIRIRVTAVDKNENRARPRWVSFRVRV